MDRRQLEHHLMCLIQEFGISDKHEEIRNPRAQNRYIIF